MPPDYILYSGIAVCGIAVIGAIIATILLRFFKMRINKQLDTEYGKRRH